MLRDENVLVLTDFGVAKWLEGKASETLHGEILGTPYYIAPEQAAGGEVTTRADLYSLGVIFYEMLTGGRPFDETSVFAAGSAYERATPWRLRRPTL